MIADIGDLSGMGDAELSSLLARCPLVTIAVALHGVDPALRKKMLRALGFVSRLRLKALPVFRSSVPLADVEAAHAYIVSAAGDAEHGETRR